MQSLNPLALAFALAVISGCASPPREVRAEVVSIRQVKERYQTGWWGVYTEVTYRVTTRSGHQKEIKRIYPDDAPEIQTLTEGKTTRLKLNAEELKLPRER